VACYSVALYADTLSDFSDNSDNEILDRDSDVTTSLCKQLRSSAVGFASSDYKPSDVCCKTNEKPNTKSFLGATVLNIVTDSSESVL
jgi:hypothetical protein